MILTCFILLLISNPLTGFLRGQNNVCRTFRDYYSPDNNPNCYYNPDTTLETTQLIKKYAGTVEIYDVVSEDGYIIRLYRIPRNNPKGVILLHHSIATYSHIYLFEGNNSLALTLWRAGYDVWLANQRGTSPSNKHIKLSSGDYKYWDFGFHEMALYDVTAELELIRQKTNNAQVILIGHSLGSNIGLLYTILKPDEAAKYLKTSILVAPGTGFTYATSAVLQYTDVILAILNFAESIQLGSPLFFLPNILGLSHVVLRMFPFIPYLANTLLLAFCGYTPTESNPTFFNYDAAIYGNDFSFKIIRHVYQIYDSKRFQMFDYGKEKNLEIYGNQIPPLYKPSRIKVPTLLVSSYNDSLTSMGDNEVLFSQLNPNVTIYGHWKLNGLNHLDYHIGIHRREVFVDKLLAFLNNL